MKSLGICRRLDSLGRVVLPIELRRTMDIEEKDSMEIFVDDDRIVLRKCEPACIFCGNIDDIERYWNKNICKKCASDISKLHVSEAVSKSVVGGKK